MVCPRAERANTARNMVEGSETKEPWGHLVNLLHFISGEAEAPEGEAGLYKVHPALSRLSVSCFVLFHDLEQHPDEVLSPVVWAKKAPHKRVPSHESLIFRVQSRSLLSKVHL